MFCPHFVSLIQFTIFVSVHLDIPTNIYHARSMPARSLACGRRVDHWATARVRTPVFGENEEHSLARGAGYPRRNILQDEEAEAKAEAERHRPGLAIFTDGSRWTATWGTTRRPTTRSVPPSPGRWKTMQGDRRPRRGSRSSPMPRPPSSAWPRRNLAPAGQMCAIPKFVMDEARTSSDLRTINILRRHTWRRACTRLVLARGTPNPASRCCAEPWQDYDQASK
jgi:hypothetical protein